MIIVGEKLNSSIPKTYTAMVNNDMEYLTEVAISQAQSGAHYLDINTAICGKEELEKMLLIVDLVRANTNCGIMLDSPSPEIIKSVIPTLKNVDIIINSLTLCERLEELVPLVLEYNCGIVALPIDLDGIPNELNKKFNNCDKLIEVLTSRGIAEGKIYIDVLAQAVAFNDQSGLDAVKTIKHIKTFHPNVNTICGLSNISFGLPKRVNMNNAFLTLALYEGLDSAIMDITNLSTMKMLYAALAICGQDEYCLEYINALR